MSVNIYNKETGDLIQIAGNAKLDNIVLEDYATKTYVTDEINKASLGGGDITLTDYLKIADAESTYCKKADFDTLKTEVGTEDISSVGTSVKDAIKKLNDKSAEYNYLVPEQFGAVGDGETDDYSAFSEMYQYARWKKKNVKIPNKNYFINGLVDAVGVSTLGEAGAILSITVNNGLAFKWGGSNTVVKNINFNLTNSDSANPCQGIFNDIQNAVNQQFINNTVTAKTFLDNGYSNIYGLWCNGTGIENFHIENNTFNNIRFAIQFNYQDYTSSRDVTTNPLGNPIKNIYIRNNIINNSNIGINTPHVFCSNLFIENNTVSSIDGFNVNLAHVKDFVVGNNILTDLKGTNDSVIHIEDVSSNGNVVNNVLYTISGSDAIRILVNNVISNDDVTVPGYINVYDNFIYGSGNEELSTDVKGIMLADTSTNYINVHDNLISGYQIGVMNFGYNNKISNNTIKNCKKGIHTGEKIKINANTFENCTTILISAQSNELSNCSMLNCNKLQPDSFGDGYKPLISYSNLHIDMPFYNIEQDKEYNILQLPTIKGTFNITFAVTEHVNYGYAKIKVTYDGTNYTIDEITNYVSGALGSINFKVSNGYLQSSSWVASTLSYVTASINIDNINYIV